MQFVPVVRVGQVANPWTGMARLTVDCGNTGCVIPALEIFCNINNSKKRRNISLVCGLNAFHPV
jgi:hypothetical protein